MRTARDQGKAFISTMRGHGLAPGTVAPPLVRLAWVLGLRVPPPVYWSRANVLAVGMIHGTVLAGLVYTIDLLMRGRVGPGWSYLLIAGISGMVYGAATAVHRKRVLRKAYSVPHWKSFA